MPQLTWEKLLCAKRSREFVSKKAGDVRSEFGKDYHRIICSASFRRLQDKTQVYPLNRGDFVRTRLTHSMEVSSFAGSLGETIFRRLIEKGAAGVTERVREDCCDILECAGLIHDIGNPPFGHFGEFAIRQWFADNLPTLTFKGQRAQELLSEQMKGDFLHFEGNAQALRVLAKLHCLVDMDNGMNLTYALLNTIIKYPVSSLGINKRSGNIKDKKMGYYVSEQALFEDITQSTGAVDCRYPLTFILESADDIAYKTADIEDAVIKGLITYPQLMSEITSFASRCNTDEERAAVENAAQRLSHYLESAQERGMPSPEEKAVQNWIVYIQGRLIYAAADAFVENYEAIMRGEFVTELLAVSPVRVLADALSDIAVKYAFRSDLILKIELSVDAMMTFLLDRIAGAALRFDTPQARITDGNLSSIISANYMKICERNCAGKTDAEQCYNRLLLVTDYVCGMTDGYARELYRSMSGIS